MGRRKMEMGNPMDPVVTRVDRTGEGRRMEKVVVMHQVVMDRVDPMGVTGVDPAGEGKIMEEAMVLVTLLVAVDKVDRMREIVVTGVDPGVEGKIMEEEMDLVTHLVAMGREDQMEEQAVPKANLGETVEGVVKIIWMPSEKSFRYS